MTLSPEDRAELWVLQNGDRTEEDADPLPDGVTTEHVCAVIRRHAEVKANTRRGMTAYRATLSTALPAPHPIARSGDPAKGPHGTQPNTVEPPRTKGGPYVAFSFGIAIILAAILAAMAAAWLLCNASWAVGVLWGSL